MKNEIKPPSVVVPLDSKTMERLYRQEFLELNCQEFSFDRAYLNRLMSTGFFGYLNNKYDLFISDFEYEDINDLVVINKILSEDLAVYQQANRAESLFWNKLEFLLREAIRARTGIFFLF